MNRARVLVSASCVALLATVLVGCAAPSKSTPAATVRVVSPTALTAADVREVLASMDPTESTYWTYRIDFPSYAASILRQGPIYIDVRDPTWGPSMFHDPSDRNERQLPVAEASATVAEAVSVFHRVQRKKGVSAAIDAMTTQGLGGEAGDPPPTHDDLLLGMLDGAADTSDFMFGQPDSRYWTWKVSRISIVGSDTARVVYTVAAPAGAKWRFTAASFTKVLHFERVADGTWLLDGWPNYTPFEREVRGSIEPSSELPSQSTWWEALGFD